MKFLNYDKVLCLSPHPDDVEYGMLGTICKYKDTKFDIVVLSQGGDCDPSTNKERQNECRNVWEKIDNIDGHFIEDTKFNGVDLVNKVPVLFEILDEKQERVEDKDGQNQLNSSNEGVQKE